MRKILLLIIFLWLIQPSLAYSNSEASDKAARNFAYNSLLKVILHSLDRTLSGEFDAAIADPGGLIVLLAEIDSDEARSLLLQMIEIYIGSANAEALDYAIVKQGKAIREGLTSLLSNPINCSLLKKEIYGKKFGNNIKCITQNARDRRIRRLIEWIDKGKTIKYVL